MGVALGYAVLAYQALLVGLNKLEVNPKALQDDLDAAWEVLAEPVQTVMRAHGLPSPYEQLKALTRGKGISMESMREFIAGLDLPVADKERLMALTPASYIGKAAELARRA
jgi:adenylosuccinate lyase